MSFALVRQSKTGDSKTSTLAKPIPHCTNNSTRDSYDSNIPLQYARGNQAVQMPMHLGTGFDFGKTKIQPKLKVSQPDDIYEKEADKVAEEVMRTSVSDPISLTTTIPDSEELVDRKCAACEMKKEEEEENLSVSRKQLLPNTADLDGADGRTNEVENVVAAGGSPLDANTKELMESRFGYVFSKVRVHADKKAAESAQAVDALAYTIGHDIVFGAGQYAPGTSDGRGLLAHELVHVIQQSRSETHFGHARMIQTYRKKTSHNFGRLDSPSLKEEEFKSKDTQPWIDRIKVNFDGRSTDINGELAPTGKLSAKYFANSVSLADIIDVSIMGGSTAKGLTDKGTGFTVHRIEGVGYNDVPLPAPEGEGPLRKYSRSLMASMNYAIFFKGKQAIHHGSLSEGSHACVHVDPTIIQQLNYHSVIGKTKVDVDYDSAALKDLCCSRMQFLGITRKGRAPNPCRSEDPSACPSP